MSITKNQAADLDEVLETLGIEQMRVAERRASAQRSLERLTDEYARITSALHKLRTIRGPQ